MWAQEADITGETYFKDPKRGPCDRILFGILDRSLEYSLSSFSKACSITRLAALSGTHRQQAEDGSVQSATNKVCVCVW